MTTTSTRKTVREAASVVAAEQRKALDEMLGRPSAVHAQQVYDDARAFLRGLRVRGLGASEFDEAVCQEFSAGGWLSQGDGRAAAHPPRRSGALVSAPLDVFHRWSKRILDGFHVLTALEIACEEAAAQAAEGAWEEARKELATVVRRERDDARALHAGAVESLTQRWGEALADAKAMRVERDEARAERDKLKARLAPEMRVNLGPALPPDVIRRVVDDVIAKYRGATRRHYLTDRSWLGAAGPVVPVYLGPTSRRRRGTLTIEDFERTRAALMDC